MPIFLSYVNRFIRTDNNFLEWIVDDFIFIWVCQVKCVSLYFSLPAVFRAAGFVCQNQYCSYLRMRACILSSIASWLRTNAQLATGRPFHFLYSSTIRR